MSRRRRLGLLVLTVAAAAGLGVWAGWRGRQPPPPMPDLTGVDAEVARLIEQARGEVQSAPRSAPAWGRLGMVLRAHGFGAEANDCFREAERLDAGEPRWPYYQGLTRVLTEPEAGLACLRRAVERWGEQGPTEPRQRLAEVLVEQGSLGEAERLLETISRQGKDQARTGLALARVALARGDWRGGLARLGPCRGDERSRKQAHLLAAEAWHRLGEPGRAGEEQAQARELPEDRPWRDPFVEEVDRLQAGLQVRLTRADSLGHQGRTAESLALLEQLTQDYPDSDTALLLLGRTLVRLRRAKEAEQALTRLVRRAPESVDGWFHLGVARAFGADAAGAAAAFRELTRIKPDHTLGHYNLGLCLKQMGDNAGARRAFEQALRCQPDYAAAQKALGEVAPKPNAPAPP